MTTISGYNPATTLAAIIAAQQAAAANSNAAAAATAGSTSATTDPSSGDQVTLSSSAQTQGSTSTQDPTQTPVTTPPADRGALVFDAQGATVGGKRVALMDIIDNTDGTYTDTERQAAVRQINQRETAGFRWAQPTSQDPTALKQYYATYLNYLKNLPPEEQNSSRYAGQIDVAKGMIQDADKQIAMSNVQQISLANYSDTSGLGLFGPLVAGITARVSQQLAGLPNTNFSSTALYFQQTINQPRTADQVLASPDPTASSDNSSDDSATSSAGGVTGGNLNIQA